MTITNTLRGSSVGQSTEDLHASEVAGSNPAPASRHAVRRHGAERFVAMERDAAGRLSFRPAWRTNPYSLRATPPWVFSRAGTAGPPLPVRPGV